MVTEHPEDVWCNRDFDVICETFQVTAKILDNNITIYWQSDRFLELLNILHVFCLIVSTSFEVTWKRWSQRKKYGNAY